MTLSHDYKALASGVTDNEAQTYLQSLQRRFADNPAPTLREKHKAFEEREKEQVNMGITFNL